MQEKIFDQIKNSEFEFQGSRYRWAKGDVFNGEYRVESRGDDWLLLIMVPDFSEPEYLEMTPQEIVDHDTIKNGMVPFVVGFKFVGPDRFRTFNVSARNGKVTSKRNLNNTEYVKVQ